MKAEQNSFKMRIKLCLLAVPLMQITGMIQLMDKVDFPFQYRAYAAFQLILQNIPLTSLIVANAIELGYWSPLSVFCLLSFVACSVQNVV